MKSRQVPFFLYWRVENVQFWINSIGHLGWLSCISNFPRFHKNVNSLELWKYISENSSPKGSFWRNKKKSEFSELSWDSPYLLAVALKQQHFMTYDITTRKGFPILPDIKPQVLEPKGDFFYFSISQKSQNELHESQITFWISVIECTFCRKQLFFETQEWL